MGGAGCNNETGGSERMVARPIINLRTPERQKTLIVVGNGRGGTSLAAGALAMLGVPMGRGDNSKEHEDTRIVRWGRALSDANVNPTVRNAAWRSLLDYIASNNDRHDAWGWKDPSADLYLEDLVRHVRNPRVIFVNRDPAAVAETTFLKDVEAKARQGDVRQASPAISIEQAYELALNRLNRYYVLLQKLGLPTLMFSFERATRNPNGAIHALALFCGIAPSRQQVELALAFCQSGQYQTIEHFVPAATAEAAQNKGAGLPFRS